LLYVSIIAPYKHQVNVALAVATLRRKKWPVGLEFVGPAEAEPLQDLRRTITKHDPSGEFLFYRGPAKFQDLKQYYAQADIFVFASSCENMPNILLEAMAAGLPIASSDRGPMPEVLGDAGAYFDPERPDSIAAALETLIADPEMRERCARRGYERAKQYSWARCAKETVSFLSNVAQAYSRSS
jgi:glycosyltransferase involved in cell wall biosynthesis